MRVQRIGLPFTVAGNFSLLNQLSDLHARLKNAVRRGPEDPLAAASADETRDAGVGQRLPVYSARPSRVAPHGLHGGVAVNPHGEAGADADHHRGVRQGGA